MRLPNVPEFRVSGVIAAGPAVPTLFRGLPSVLSRSRVGGADETRGIDFSLVVDGGGQASVRARGAILLDRPRRTREPPACGAVCADSFGKGEPRLRSALLDGTSFWRLVRPGRGDLQESGHSVFGLALRQVDRDGVDSSCPKAVDERAHRLELTEDLGVPAAVDHGQLGRHYELVRVQPAFKVRHRRQPPSPPVPACRAR